MKLLYIFYLLVFSGFVAEAQLKIDTIKGSFEKIFVDNNENIYALTESGINKYNKNLEFLYTYEFNRYGKPSVVDAHIPMKLLLFFSSYNIAIVLDNRLAVVRQIDVTKFSEEFNNVLCFSADNNIWLFDNNLQSLTKYSQSLKVQYTYENMNLRMNQFIQASEMQEVNNYLVLCDTLNGFYIFDMLGNFVNQFVLPGIRNYQLLGSVLYFLQDGQLRSFDILDENSKTFTISVKQNVIDFKINGSHLLVLEKGLLYQVPIVE